ncbi:MAG: hypothetical protein J6Z34_06975 [Clostridia bacterium]|nr:hypothetical protein [Clostridia bacterium]
MNNDNHKYDDIIDLPHHVSQSRPRMSVSARAAQFSPFAALSGYGETIKETARFTEEKAELGEDDLNILNEKITYLQGVIGERPYVKVAYFARDQRKAGGSYKIYAGRAAKIDALARALFFTDGTAVAFDDITDIEYGFLSEEEENGESGY